MRQRRTIGNNAVWQAVLLFGFLGLVILDLVFLIISPSAFGVLSLVVMVIITIITYNNVGGFGGAANIIKYAVKHHKRRRYH